MPQQKGEVPAPLQKRLVNARAALDAAQVEYDQAVYAALEAGGSHREIGRYINRSGNQVGKLSKRLGWPPPEVREERDRQRWEATKRNAEFEALRERFHADPESVKKLLADLAKGDQD